MQKLKSFPVLTLAALPAVAIAASVATSTTAEAQAWCNKSRLKPAEETICSSSQLRTLDRVMNTAYQRARFDSSPRVARRIRRSQRRWLRQRNRCRFNAGCLRVRYRNRISFLEGFFAN